MIGQHVSSIAGAFPAPIQVDTTDDHWISRAYVVDRATRSYMAFKFPAGSDFAISVQIAGGPGTPMLPFLGLRLGDSSSVVISRLGQPSAMEPQQDWPATLWTYDGRNYSVEIDTTGHLSSIQIYDVVGLPPEPPSPTPSLEHLQMVLAMQTPDSMVAELAPDIEIRWRGHPVRFTSSALRSVADSTSDVHNALYGDWPSLRTLLGRYGSQLQAVPETRADGNKTVRYRVPGQSFPTLVFVSDAGAWRVWEVDFGPD